jgi:hypothetical protein
VRLRYSMSFQSASSQEMVSVSEIGQQRHFALAMFTPRMPLAWSSDRRYSEGLFRNIKLYEVYRFGSYKCHFICSKLAYAPVKMYDLHTLIFDLMTGMFTSSCSNTNVNKHLCHLSSGRETICSTLNSSECGVINWRWWGWGWGNVYMPVHMLYHQLLMRLTGSLYDSKIHRSRCAEMRSEMEVPDV